MTDTQVYIFCIAPIAIFFCALFWLMLRPTKPLGLGWPHPGLLTHKGRAYGLSETMSDVGITFANPDADDYSIPDLTPKEQKRAEEAWRLVKQHNAKVDDYVRRGGV